MSFLFAATYPALWLGGFCECPFYPSHLSDTHWNHRFLLSSLAFCRFRECEFKSSHLCGKHFAYPTISLVLSAFSYSFSKYLCNTRRYGKASLLMRLLINITLLINYDKAVAFLCIPMEFFELCDSLIKER